MPYSLTPSFMTLVGVDVRSTLFHSSRKCLGRPRHWERGCCKVHILKPILGLVREVLSQVNAAITKGLSDFGVTCSMEENYYLDIGNEIGSNFVFIMCFNQL